MEAITFWIVAAGMVISAIAVIANRNPVACALSLALTFIFLAVGFLSLQALLPGHGPGHCLRPER
jgi:NADH:ubiquinone oxidoreductase subunit 6 (subunit J)